MGQVAFARISSATETHYTHKCARNATEKGVLKDLDRLDLLPPSYTPTVSLASPSFFLPLVTPSFFCREPLALSYLLTLLALRCCLRAFTIHVYDAFKSRPLRDLRGLRELCIHFARARILLSEVYQGAIGAIVKVLATALNKFFHFLPIAIHLPLCALEILP